MTHNSLLNTTGQKQYAPPHTTTSTKVRDVSTCRCVGLYERCGHAQPVLLTLDSPIDSVDTGLLPPGLEPLPLGPSLFLPALSLLTGWSVHLGMLTLMYMYLVEATPTDSAPSMSCDPSQTGQRMPGSEWWCTGIGKRRSFST